MTSRPLAQSHVGTVAAIGLSLNVAAAEPDWPDLPMGVKNGVSARVGDTIYVGLGSAGSAFYALDLKDRAKGWVSRSSFPGPATNGAAAATSHGQIFVFSGNGKPTPDAKSPIIFNTIYSYDPATDIWHGLDATTPVGLSGARAISLSDGRIAVVGGYNKELFDKYLTDVSAVDKEKSPLDFEKLVASYMSMEPKNYRWNSKVLAFDPRAKSWTDLGESSFLPNCDAAIVPVDQSTFLLISGEIKPGLRTPNVKSIAFAGGSIEWRQLPDLPKPSGDALQEGVAGAYAGSVGDAVLVAGGANFRGARGRAEAGRWFAHEGLAKSWRTEIYAWSRGSWAQVGELPKGLAYGASFSTPEGVLMVGGEDDAGNARKEVSLLAWDGQSVSIEE